MVKIIFVKRGNLLCCIIYLILYLYIFKLILYNKLININYFIYSILLGVLIICRILIWRLIIFK